jgi:hypothetical protein
MSRPILRVLAGLLLVGGLFLASDVRQSDRVAAFTVYDPPADEKSPAGADRVVDVQLIDGSSIKVVLRAEKIEFQTRYGKLLIPTRDLQRVDFRWRLSPETARQIKDAIGDLGAKDFQKREAATAALRRLGERAVPALTLATADSDPEVARRVHDLLEKIRETVPVERLLFREDDVIWAGDNKLVGRISEASLNVETLAFGTQSLRLSDVKSLRPSGMSPDGVAVGAPDPGTLAAFQDEVGKTFTFRVTGSDGTAAAAPALPAAPAPAPRPVAAPVAGPVAVVFIGGAVWGTDIYSADSTLAMAAVHAGVLRAGETGTVKVTILGPQPAFMGSTRHGVTSMPYGAWPGSFKVSR